MKKINHKLFVVAFAIVLFGIVAIQGYWIKTALEVRSKQFDAAVFNSLNEISFKEEQKENLVILKEANSIDTLIEDIHPNKSVQVRKSKKNKTDNQILSSYSYSITNDSVNIRVESDVNDKEMSAFVFSNEDTIISEEHLINDKLSKVRVLIKKLVAGKNDLTLKLNAKEIDSSLTKILNQNNITTPFLLALKEDNKLTYISDSTFREDIVDSEYHIKIFPNDVLMRDAELYVFFPKKKFYLFSSVVWIMLMLLVFIVLLFYIFYITLKNYGKQKQLNEIKSEFINNMTHELKTPLATIQLASEVINKQATDEQEQIKKMAKTIKEQSIKMDNDIKNMLQHSVIEQSSFTQLNKSLISVSELINMSIEHVDLIAGDKGIKFNVVNEKDYVLNVDRELLQKALINVLDNAIKYSGNDTEVGISIKNDNFFCILTISNTGQGISKEDLPFVFDKFYRSGKGNIHSNKGYGLGLSFVKRIVELHEGRVEAKSDEGKETSIVISLPLNEN